MNFVMAFEEIDLMSDVLKAGDIVHVVADPYMSCPFTWVADMTQYCGKMATITRIDTGMRGFPNSFLISIDGGVFRWSAGCFQEVYDVYYPRILPADEHEISDLFWGQP